MLSSLAQVVEALKGGRLSSEEVIGSLIAVAKETQVCNAFITPTFEEAMVSARKGGMEECPLGGAGIGIKDVFCSRGIRTTAGSKMLENFVPPYESAVTENLLRGGGISLGKLNMDAFAMGSSNETSFYGACVNPWRRNEEEVALVPGGSSGGSAVAVAVGSVLAAIGTDTGGSIRQPASFCGVVGLKPTYGVCSRWGMVAFASSLDTAGPMTRTVEDAALMLQVMASHDKRDATSRKAPWRTLYPVPKGIKGLKVGIPKEYRMEEVLEKDIIVFWDKAREWLKEQGAEIQEVTLPHTKYALPAYYILAPAEASSNLARYDGLRFGFSCREESLEETYINTRTQGFSDENVRRILIGTHVLSSGQYDLYYKKAQKVRRVIAEELRKVFQSVDLLLTPTTPTVAFEIGYQSDSVLKMYGNDIFAVPSSLSGLPAISVPVGLSSEGLPVGLQLIAGAFQEPTLLRGAQALEEAAAFQEQPTPWWKQ